MSSSDEDLLMLLLLNSNNKNTNVNEKRKRKYWVHPYLKKNVDNLGTFSVAKELKMFPEKFQNFYRMTQKSFEFLTELVRPILKKKDTNFRKSITVEERLLITLR